VTWWRLQVASGGPGTAVQSAIAPWVDIAFDNAVRLDSAYDGCEYVNLAAPPARPTSSAHSPISRRRILKS